MEYIDTLKNIIEDLYNRNNVIHPADWELRQMAENMGTLTEFGNVNFSTSVRNRSSAVTVYIGSEKVQQESINERQKAIIANAPETIKKVNEYIKTTPLVCVEQFTGHNELFNPHCRLYSITL